MKEKYISRISLLINVIIFIGIGISLIAIPKNSLRIFYILCYVSITGLGIVSLITYIIKKNDNLINSITMILLGAFIYFFPNIFMSSFPFLFGIYLLANGIINFIAYLIYKYLKLENRYIILFKTLFDFIFSLIMIFNPYTSIHTFSIIIGIYLILLGLTNLYDLLRDIAPNFFNPKKRHLRIAMPVIVLSILPYASFTKINKFLNNDITKVDIKKKEKERKSDIEIFIHIADDSTGKFGHVDFYFENKVYAYGKYDEDSRRLFETIGDGVLFEVDSKNDYIKFCTTKYKKTIFGFGISLTEDEKQSIRDKIDKIKANTYVWKCKKEEDPTHDYQDYASLLYQNTKVNFYKFNKTSYKVYFLFTTNCVKLTDDVLGVTGSDILKINGIITPGSYYNYLNNEFKKVSSKVVTKHIYTNSKNKKN